MQAFIQNWSEWVLRLRHAIIGGVILLCGLAFWPISQLYYDNSNELFFLEGDPNLVAYNNLIDLFGDPEYLSVSVRVPEHQQDVFHPDTLTLIEDVTRFLERRPEVTQVRSLTRYQHTHSGSGMLATDDVITSLESADALDRARAIIQQQPMALGTLVTEDLQHTRVVARTRYATNGGQLEVELVQALRAFLDSDALSTAGHSVHLSGQPVFTEQFETLSKRDQAWINPLMALVMIVLLWLSFRSIVATLLPWTIIGTAILLVSGFQGLMGWPHTVVESALIPTLIIIGVGLSVHVLVTFFHQRAQGLAPPEAAAAMVRKLWTPAFYTALTTAAGFLALSVTQLVPVREFAWLGAAGAMTLFLLSMTLFPAILSHVSAFSMRTERIMTEGAIARFTHWVPGFTLRHRRSLLALGGGLLVTSLAIVPRIEVDSNFITYFKQDNPTRSDLLYFNETYNGIQNIDIIVDSGTPGGIHEPAFLQQFADLQTWLEAQPETGNVNTVVDFLRTTNQALNEDDPAHYQLPDNRQMAAQLLFLYDNTGPEEDLSDIKDFDEQYLRLSVPVLNMPASATSEFLQRVSRHLQEQHAELPVQLTGSLVMYNAQDLYIADGMFRSFMIALLIIALSFMVLFRSVKYGLIALVPSVVPIIMTGSLLVLLGIPLNLGTMVVGAMTMGIAVDDAIHVMNRYLTARRSGESTYPAILRAMTESGRAVIFTSIVLIIGFSVMLLGSFVPYIYVGLFAATIMALALIGDLIFLPAILHWVDREATDRSDTVTDSSPALTKEVS